MSKNEKMCDCNQGRLPCTCKPPEQHQVDPVALPARRDESTESYTACLQSSGWNACLDELAKLGPLYTRPAQGEPVAWLDPNAGLSWLVDRMTVAPGTKLYTHADPAEVERVREENERLLAGFYQQVKDADLKKIAEFIGDGDLPTKSFFMRPDAANLANMTMHMVRDVQAMRAQLAEAHALLREAYNELAKNAVQDIPATLMDKIDSALSASAEPSAPVERDERAEFELYRDRRNALLISEGSSAKWRVTQAHYATWEARAALERMP